MRLPRQLGALLPHLTRPFSSSAIQPAKALPPRPRIPETDLEEEFLKGSGPGGQKINKTNSAVQLRHTPTGIVVKCQETRSREQNRKIARMQLAEKLDVLEKGMDSRMAIKARDKAKKKASAAKKSRRKYRKLAEEKAAGAGNEGEGQGESRSDGRDAGPDDALHLELGEGKVGKG